jgi:hypothetical protein
MDAIIGQAARQDVKYLSMNVVIEAKYAFL